MSLVVVTSILISGVIYVLQKKDVGQVIARQMIPRQLAQIVLIALVLGMLYSLSGTVENVAWLIMAALIPLLVVIEVIHAVSPISIAEKVLLEPDPAYKNAARLGALQILIGVVNLVEYFSTEQSDPHRLALSALFLASAALNLIYHFKPATLTEIGYYHPYRIVRWSDLEAYQWIGKSDTHDILIYQRKTRWPIVAVAYLQIPTINQPRVNEFLSRYVVPTSTLSVALD
jgi:hypothetical protein